MLAELLRRAGVVLLWLGVAIAVVLGELYAIAYTPAPARQLRPKGAEIRVIRPIGRRVLALRLQVILA